MHLVGGWVLLGHIPPLLAGLSHHLHGRHHRSVEEVRGEGLQTDAHQDPRIGHPACVCVDEVLGVEGVLLVGGPLVRRAPRAALPRRVV